MAPLARPAPGHAPADDAAVLATFAGMRPARRAIEALQLAGVEATRITLAGEGAAAARAADNERDTSARDLGMLRRIIWLSVLWGVAGAAVGALVGVAAGSLGLFGGNMGIQIAGWAMFFHVSGGLVGAYAAISNGDAWEMTFQRADSGPVEVRVRPRNAADARRIEALLRAKRPLALSRETAAPA
jgi:hypothetical protein